MTDSKYLKAIIEYDAARIEIKTLSESIANQMGVQCHCSEDTGIEGSCLEKLYEFNQNARDSDLSGFGESIGKVPFICPRCKRLDELIQDRKKSKLRFGYSKTSISRLARDYRNSFQLTTG